MGVKWAGRLADGKSAKFPARELPNPVTSHTNELSFLSDIQKQTKKSNNEEKTLAGLVDFAVKVYCGGDF